MAKDIGSLIRKMRKAAGMSQQKLADGMGVSYQQIQKYEKGSSALSIPRLHRLAEIFAVPITAFLEDDMLESNERQVLGAALSVEEAEMLQLMRRLPTKMLRQGLIILTKDLVKLAEGK